MADRECPLYEGDNVLLYSSEKDGFLYAEPSSAHTGSLTLKPVSNPQDPQFPILAFAVFKVIPENECITVKKPQHSSRTTLVFGRRVRLFNAASQQFVSVSSSSIDTAKNDATVFVIRSPISTESRGKDVLCQGSIRLESDCNRGCFMSAEYDLATDSQNVILRGLGLKFIVYLHSRQSEDDEKYLLAGTPVMLHSVKRDGELSARSCFLMNSTDESDRAVECRRRVKVHGVDKAPPESGDTFWQLELISQPYSGKPLHWRDKCRIKHLPSHLYVAVVPVSGAEDKYKVILQEPSEKCDVRDECFILVQPENQNEDGQILHGSHLLLIHEKTHRRIIVSATTKEIQAKHVFYSTNRRLHVTTTLNQAPVDMSIFRVDQVQRESAVEFYYATSWASAMAESASWLKVGGSIKPEEVDTITGSLSVLVSWLHEAANPSRRVDMLRTLTVVELLFGILESCSVSLDDFGSMSPDEDAMLKSILKCATDTLKKYIQVAKPKSRRYLIQEEFLRSLFGKPSSRACIQEVLAVLAKSDSVSADKIAEYIFEHNISDLLQGKDSINFLMGLSTASNKYARQIQNILFLTIESAPCDTHIEKRLDTVVRYMMTIADFSVPTIDKLWKTFEYTRLTPFDPWRGASVRSPYSMVQKPDVIRELQKNIREHLKENASISPTKDATERNTVTLQLLRIFESLVKYGFYSSEEQLRILPYLVSMLDGSTDYSPQQNQQSSWKLLTVVQRNPPGTSGSTETVGRYSNVKLNRQVVKIKTIGVRILQSFFTMFSYITLERFLYDYKSMMESSGTYIRKASQTSLPAAQAHCTALNELHERRSNLLMPQNLFKSQSEEDLLDDGGSEQYYYYTPPPMSLSPMLKEQPLTSTDLTERFVLEARRRIERMFDDGGYSAFNIDTIEGNQLVRVLVELLDYKDSELCLSAAQLLFDMHSKGRLLMNSVHDVHLVTQHMRYFLKKVLRISSLSEDNPHLLEMMDELCKECVKKNDENEPSICEQSILYSSGLFLLVLEYIFKYGLSDDRMYERPKLKCYELLRRIARKNPKAQLKLFHSLGDLLKERLCVFSMAELLTEVFSNNEELCRIACSWDPGLKQFLTEAISSDNPEHNELLHTMTVILKSSSSTKVDVTRLIQEASLSDLRHILGDSEVIKRKRMTLLQQCRSDEISHPRGENHWDDYYDICLLLNVTDLLATCCQGELLQSEQVASKLFSLEEIIRILSHPHIPLENKKPFISLLTWAFVETERDSLVCLTHLAKNKYFITHLGEVTLLVKALIDNLCGVDLSEVQRNLRILNKRHLSVMGWMRFCRQIPEVIVNVGGFTATLQGLLLYLLHGLAPLLALLCSKLENHQQRNKESRRLLSDLYNPMFLNVLEELGIAVTMFQRKWRIFKEPEHTEVLSNCLRNIDAMLRSSPIKRRHSQVVLESNIGIPIIVRTIRDTDSEDVATEKTLNKMLAVFVSNYSRACGSYTKEEMEYKEHSSKFVEFVYASPHGKNLQSLVDLFEDDDSDDEHSNLRKLLRLLDITFSKLHRQTNGLERVQLDRVLYITLQIISCLLQRRVTMVEMAKEHKRRKVYERTLKPLQDQLLEMKAHEKIMKHVSHPCEEIILKVIAVLKQLLFYGNSSAQELIGSQISTDQAELLFPKFRKMLEAADLALTSSPQSAHVSISVKLTTNAELPPPTALQDGKPPPFMSGKPSMQFLHQQTVTYSQVQPEELAIELMNMVHYEGGIEVRPTQSTSVVDQISIDIDENHTGASSPEPTVQVVSRAARRGILKRMDVLDIQRGDTVHVNSTVTTKDVEQEESLYLNDVHMNTLGDKEANAVLDVISFLCDGQRKDLQDMFGRETTHFAGSNMIIQITFLLEGVAETVNDQNLRIAGRAIQALIELCAGNFNNQEVAFRGQALVSINTFLKLDPMSFEKDMWLGIMSVKCSAVELLEVMLEETDPSSSILARKIYAQLIINDLLLTMKQLWEAYAVPAAADSKKNKSKWRNGLLKSYHTLKMIAHYRGSIPEPYIKNHFRLKFGKFDRSVKKMLNFCEEWSHSIEIEYKPKGILTRVHFPFPPEAHLSGSDKDTIKSKIRRDSEDEKLRDLLKWTEGIRKHQRWMRQINKRVWIKWVTKFPLIRNTILIILTLALNMLLFIAIQTDETKLNNSTITVVVTPHLRPYWYWPYTLYSLGVLHLILSLWMVVDFYVKEYPHIHLDSPLVHTMMWRLSQREPKLLKILAKILNRPIKITKPQPYGHFNRSIVDIWGCYRILFFLCSCVSLGTDGTFYPICLIYIFIDTEFMGTILTSVTKSALSLTIIFLLGLVILMGYAVVAFSIFNTYFHAPSQGLFCDTLFACFVTVVRLGALANPPLGDNITISGKFIALSLFRLAYGISFFIVVTTLGLNVVIAILVDNFSALRQTKNEVEQDKQSVCFICGLTKSDLDHRTKMHGGFINHVQSDHCMWNYIYFAIYLDYLDENDHNALEKYIFDQMTKREIDFFPKGQAKVIADAEAHSMCDDHANLC